MEQKNPVKNKNKKRKTKNPVTIVERYKNYEEKNQATKIKIKANEYKSI